MLTELLTAPDLRMSDTAGGEQPSTVTVRMDADLVRMARVICAHTPGRGGKQLKLVDYLDSLLRGPITERHAEIMAQIAQEHAQGKKSSGPRRNTR